MSEPVKQTSFHTRMGLELHANSHKGNWDEWIPSKGEALSELRHHLQKLEKALEESNQDQISEFAADSANILMKISDTFGTTGTHSQPAGLKKAQAIIALAKTYLLGVIGNTESDLPTPGWDEKMGKPPTTKETHETFDLFFEILKNREILETQINEIEKAICEETLDPSPTEAAQYKFLKRLQEFFDNSYGRKAIQTLFRKEKPTEEGSYHWILPTAEKQGYYHMAVRIGKPEDNPEETGLRIYSDEGDEICPLRDAKDGFWAKKEDV